MSTQEETKVLDVAGEEIKVGDIVYRARFSGFTVHRVTRFTKMSIFLSVERIISDAYNYVNSNNREDLLSQHNSEFSMGKRFASQSLIKKQYHGDPTDFIQIGQQDQAQSI